MQAEFLVIPGDQPPLLGKRTAEELGVLNIGLNFVTKSELDSYPGIADGIGNLKDFEVKIHVDPSTAPVARKHFRTMHWCKHAVIKILEIKPSSNLNEPPSSSLFSVPN